MIRKYQEAGPWVDLPLYSTKHHYCKKYQQHISHAAHYMLEDTSGIIGEDAALPHS